VFFYYDTCIIATGQHTLFPIHYLLTFLFIAAHILKLFVPYCIFSISTVYTLPSISNAVCHIWIT